ncbi:MAG: AI-2E family transporter [Bryobacterales bacterium]|nr:AI-2E family transporter [Bryobacterales bacterium]MBV9398876.1 AI-2E family transporter [Bryobacterales bacterium]
MYTPTTPAQRSVQTGLNVLAAAAAVALLYYGRLFFITVTIAAMIAFLLEPLVDLFMKLRLPRGLASFVVCSISLLVLYLAGLGLYSEGQLMVQDLPTYSSRINEIVDNAAARVDDVEQRISQTIIPRRFREGPPQTPQPVPAPSSRSNRKKQPDTNTNATPPPIQEVRVRPETPPLLAFAYGYLRDYFDVLLMASFVPFLVYFILSWRDHVRSRLLVMFEGDARYTITKAIDGLADMVRAYVIGNFLLGIVLSIASSILFAVVKLPYWIMIGPLSGFLSLIPYIGLPLAMLPPVLAALPVTREPAVYVFLIASVAILHLLALNLLYPKFVGSRVHLNPLVGTIALMFWGMMWGAVGLLLAIPLTAALKTLCDNVSRLQPYGRLLGD